MMMMMMMMMIIIIIIIINRSYPIKRKVKTLFLSFVLCSVVFVCLQPGQHPKELNPYWKDGGIGLPSERKRSQDTSQVEGI